MDMPSESTFCAFTINILCLQNRYYVLSQKCMRSPMLFKNMYMYFSKMIFPTVYFPKVIYIIGKTPHSAISKILRLPRTPKVNAIIKIVQLISFFNCQFHSLRVSYSKRILIFSLNVTILKE